MLQLILVLVAFGTCLNADNQHEKIIQMCELRVHNDDINTLTVPKTGNGGGSIFKNPPKSFYFKQSDLISRKSARRENGCRFFQVGSMNSFLLGLHGIRGKPVEVARCVLRLSN